MRNVRRLILAVLIVLSTSQQGVLAGVKTETLPSGLTAYLLGECEEPHWSRFSDTSIALDSLGRQHMAFKSISGQLRYVIKNGSDWDFNTIKVGSYHNYGGNNAIAIDQNNRAHISFSYSDHAAEDFYYFNGKKTYRLDSPLSVGLNNDIALSTGDDRHFVYDFWNTNELIYMFMPEGTSENTKTVIGKSGSGPTSLMLDSYNDPHILFVNWSSLMTHAFKIGDSWTSETIPNAYRGGCATIEDNTLYLLSRGGLFTKPVGGSEWSQRNIFEEMNLALANKYNSYMPYLDEDSIDVESGIVHFTFLVSNDFRKDGDYYDDCTLYYASNITGKYVARMVDHWQTDRFFDLPPALVVGDDGLVNLIYVKTDDYQARYLTLDPLEFLTNYNPAPILNLIHPNYGILSWMEVTWSGVFSGESFLSLVYDLYKQDLVLFNKVNVPSTWYPFENSPTDTLKLKNTGAYHIWVFSQDEAGAIYPCQNPWTGIIYGGDPHAPLDFTGQSLGKRQVQLNWKPEMYGTWIYWAIAYDLNTNDWVETEGSQDSNVWQYVSYGSDQFNQGTMILTVPAHSSYFFFLFPMSWPQGYSKLQMFGNPAWIYVNATGR